MRIKFLLVYIISKINSSFYNDVFTEPCHVLCFGLTLTYGLDLIISVPPIGHLSLHLDRYLLRFIIKSQALQLVLYLNHYSFRSTIWPWASIFGLHLNSTYGCTMIKSRSHRTELIPRGLGPSGIISFYLTYKTLSLNPTKMLLLMLSHICHLPRLRYTSS